MADIDWRKWGDLFSGLGTAFAPPGSWQEKLGQMTMEDTKRRAAAKILSDVASGKPIDKADLQYVSPEVVATAANIRQQKLRTAIEAKQVGGTIEYQKQLAEESKARVPTYEAPAERRAGEQAMQESLIGTQAEAQKGVQAAGYKEKAKYEPTLIPGQQNVMYDWKTKQWIQGPYTMPGGAGGGLTDPTKMNQYRDLVVANFMDKAEENFYAQMNEGIRDLAKFQGYLGDPTDGRVFWPKLFKLLTPEQQEEFSSQLAMYSMLPEGYPGETIFAEQHKLPQTIVQQFTNPQTGVFDTKEFTTATKQLPPEKQSQVMKQLMLEGGTMSAAETPEELLAAYNVNPTAERYKQMLEEIKRRGWKTTQ